jgi:glycosyltransferase involved in cell wall biosynthesis
LSDTDLLYHEIVNVKNEIIQLRDDVRSHEYGEKSRINRFFKKVANIIFNKDSFKKKVKLILKMILKKNGVSRTKVFGYIIRLARFFISKRVPKMLYTEDDRISSALRKVIKENPYNITHIITVPFLKRGGADLVTINYTKVILQNPNNRCMILMTDSNDEPDMLVDWLPKGVITVSISSYIDMPNWRERTEIVYGLIQFYLPKTLHIINSSAAWMMVTQKGHFIPSGIKLFGSIFAMQFDDNGELIGYAADYLRKAMPYMQAIITDNSRFVGDAIQEFAIQKDQQNKFTVIYNPSRIEINRLPRFCSNSDTIKLLWAGRIDKEKYPDMIAHIIKATGEFRWMCMAVLL